MSGEYDPNAQPQARDPQPTTLDDYLDVIERDARTIADKFQAMEAQLQGRGDGSPTGPTEAQRARLENIRAMLAPLAAR